MGSLRILIVDDHEIVRRGVRTLLSSRRDWVVCGEAEDGLEAVEKAKILRPDLVLMDIYMPRMDGVEATRIILNLVAWFDTVATIPDTAHTSSGILIKTGLSSCFVTMPILSSMSC